MPSIRSLLSAPALMAAASLVATPAQAAELRAPTMHLPIEAAPAWDPGDDQAANHRHYRYRHRRDRVDAGDVIAGVLILGGIAAIASAAKNSQSRYRDRDWRYPDPRRGDWRYGAEDARGIDRAVSMCVDAIERDARVETVDNVSRSARGWEVTGSLYNGQGFACSIGEDGRIEAVDYGTDRLPYRGSGADTGATYADDEVAEDRQYDDDYYAAARARSDTAARPAYPGGPLPGEDAEPDGEVEFGTGYAGSGT